MNGKIAVVCAAGIGDALILHIASHNLQEAGCEVTTFSNHLTSFGRWLEGYRFAPQPRLEKIEETFQPFDTVFLQHDNSPKAKKIQKLPLPVYTFYGAHHPSKHGPFREKLDFLCNPNQTMVANVRVAMWKFFGLNGDRNGLRAPEGLAHRRYAKRIAIHPTSALFEKNWPREKFLVLADRLQREGYNPIFTVSPEERQEWEGPLFTNLEELTSFLYESGAFLGNDSGLAHIASYLKIPHLVIGPSARHMRLWRPGWHPGETIVPPAWVVHWKGIGKHWKLFIPTRKVIKRLKDSVLTN